MEEKISTNEFRTEINGLRAVAVILVLLFHLEFHFFDAGFLGVDVFLVISGYLISRNILRDLSSGKFSFAEFYTRRFNRLYPALVFTLLISLIVGYFSLPAADLQHLSKSAISGLFWVSNIFFWSETGYFNAESAFNPLLHVWSLSLEEQFYFVWPLILWLTFKLFRKVLFLVVVVLAIISLFICGYYIQKKPDAVFYLLPPRFFEFLLGAACIWLERFKINRKFVAELAILGGLALIGYSAIGFSELTPMPGVLSLIPCGGAMLIIYGGDAKYTGWVLRNKFSEIIGRSSYSIYLIHWPLIVYFKYFTLADLTNYIKVSLALASILLGYLMWRYVEKISKIEFKNAVWFWMQVTLILTIAAFTIWNNKGYPSRYFTMTEEDIAYNRNKYWETNGDQAILNGTNNKTAIVVGNSFAIDLIYALRKNGFEANIVALQTSHRCFNFSASPAAEEDRQFCEAVKQEILTSNHWSKADVVYLFDHWPEREMDDLEEILIEIRALTKAPIYVLGPKMLFTQPIPHIVHQSRSATTSVINRFAQNFAEKENRYELNDALIRFFEKAHLNEKGIFFIDVLKVLKNGESSFDVISNQNADFLYFDSSHFTDQGAKEFGEKLKRSYPELFNIVQ